MLSGIEQTIALPAGHKEDDRPDSSPPDAVRHTTFAQGRRMAFVTSVFNLLNAILGSGVLGLPYIVAKSGPGLFVILIVIMACLVDFSLQLLLAAALTTNCRNYPLLGKRALGDWGQAFVCFIIMLQNTGGIVSYFTVVKDVVGDVMEVLVHDDGSFLRNRDAMASIICFCVAFPLALSPKIGWLGYVGVCSFAAFAWFAFFVVGKLIVQGSYCGEDSNSGSGSGADCSVEVFNPTLDTFLAVPTMCFSFVCHTTVLPVAEELEAADTVGRTKRDRKRMSWVVHTSVLLAMSIYTLVSICAYLTFRGETKKDLLLSYGKRDGDNGLSVFTRLLFAVAVLLGAPVLCFPYRKALWTLIEIQRGESMSEAVGREERRSRTSSKLYLDEEDDEDVPWRTVEAATSSPGKDSFHTPNRGFKESFGATPGTDRRRRSGRLGRSDSFTSKVSAEWHLKHENLHPAEEGGGCVWWLKHVGVTFSAMGFMLALALSVPHITVVFGAVGATSSVTLVFILPAIIFEKLCMNEENLLLVQARGSWRDCDGELGRREVMPDRVARHGPRFMLILGVMIFFISWGGIIYGWIQNGFK
eukprot:Hpha_TRINITY_DN16002_c2_g9::TRINITY_DN16002_c2_g9_i1::g.122088::m.122088/K14993/SLC38A6, SNAT6; solute carrier family 38 (sodium-coupled neutral amino acid transporter), member 6